MKKSILILSIILIAVSCGVSRKASKAETAGREKIVVGISRNGIPEYKRDNFRKCIHDAGAEVFFFPTYPENDSVTNAYLDKVDCLIIPGTGADDTVGRKYYDARIIKAAMARRMPLFGICEGHQRINQVLGGTIDKVAEYYPESKIKHSIVVDGKNIGAVSEAHVAIVDTNSVLYSIFGEDSLMVNTSHRYCARNIPSSLTVTAVAPDGVVEALEAPGILCLQFHPEYMYGNMGLAKFLKYFEYVVAEGRKYRSGDDEEEAIPFVLVKEKPKFRGGDADKFSKWVINNLVYPEIAKKNGIEGRVSLQFTIDTDGTVRDVVVLRGVNALLDREAVRIVSSSPKWTPGRIGDRPVKVTYTMPIIFYLKNNWEKRARVTPVPETI